MDVQTTRNAIDVHPGELRQAIYEVSKGTDRAITGQAIPSYAPREAGQYFPKLDGFCFETLQLGAVRQMPVVSLIDTKVPWELATIRPSYTFFEVEGSR